MNQKMKRFSLTHLSYMEEMKAKLQKLDSVRYTTNAMIAQFDLHPKNNMKRNTDIQQKPIYSRAKRRTLQPLLQRLIQNNSPFDLKTPVNERIASSTPYSITPPNLRSPMTDEFSPKPMKDKFHHDFQEDSHFSEYSHRTSHSITSSSSPSKNSRNEPPLTLDTLIIGRLVILNEIYPSMESDYLNDTPLAFLGSDKFLHNRVNWTRVRYPLSSYHIEIIIDLIITRPSFVREIPKVTKFNLYRPLIQIVSGRLFFDHGEHKAGLHRCHRKLINHKFTIEDLASIHKREFYIINYNVTREERFINLYESLFQIHLYQPLEKHNLSMNI